MPSLKQINKICAASSGGLLSTINIIDHDHVGKLNYKYGDFNFSNDLLLNADSQVIDIEVKFKSARFTEKQVSNKKHGDYFDKKLSFEIRKDREEVYLLSQCTLNKRYVVVHSNRMGQQKISFGMKLVSGFDSGVSASDGEISSFEFNSKSIYKSSIFTGSIIYVT